MLNHERVWPELAKLHGGITTPTYCNIVGVITKILQDVLLTSETLSCKYSSGKVRMPSRASFTNLIITLIASYVYIGQLDRVKCLALMPIKQMVVGSNLGRSKGVFF